MTALLEVESLHVRYGRAAALHGVRFRVGPGAAVALLGANGAGKTTLLKAVIGLLPAAAGTVRFDGQDVSRWPPQRRARLGIGYCPEGRHPFPGLTAEENLAVACWDGAHVRRRRIGEMYALFPALADKRGVPAWQLSGGQQQMLAIARSLMGAPRLLLLDEPAIGLSPPLVEEVYARIPAIQATGCAVLLADQVGPRALLVCQQAVVLRDGRMVPQGAASLPNAEPAQAPGRE